MTKSSTNKVSVALRRFASDGRFASAFEPRHNSFGFLRLVFAGLVLYSHSFALGGFGPEPLMQFSQGRLKLGTFAVFSFFIVSGFLIMRSIVTSGSVVTFLWHRFLRIYPGYLVCLLVSALVFVPIYCVIEGRPVAPFMSEHAATIRSYVTANAWLQINQWDIPPLLAGVPFSPAIDGSLWTLILEWRCYLLVAIIGLTVWLRGTRWLVLALSLGAYYASIAQAYALHDQAAFPVWFADSWFTQLSSYFLVASALFMFRQFVPNSMLLFLVCVWLFRYSLQQNWLAVAGPLTLGYAVLWLAFNLPGWLEWVDRKGDISYGVYIYAFPVQQGLAAAGLNHHGFLLYFVAATLITGVFAFLSFRFVEKPCLRWKRFDPTFGVAKRAQVMFTEKIVSHAPAWLLARPERARQSRVD